MNLPVAKNSYLTFDPSDLDLSKNETFKDTSGGQPWSTHQVSWRSDQGPGRRRGTNKQTDKRCSNYSMMLFHKNWVRKVYIIVIFFSFCLKNDKRWFDKGYAINITYCIPSNKNLRRREKMVKFLSRCKGVSHAGRV